MSVLSGCVTTDSPCGAALMTPLLFDPGTRWEYGTNVDWVGQVIEGITGQRLGAGPGVGMGGLGRRGWLFLPDRGRAPLGRPCLVSGPGKRRQRQRHHSRKGCQAESAMNDTNCAHGILGSR